MATAPQTSSAGTGDGFREHFTRHGWVDADLLDAPAAMMLRRWIDEIAAWADTGGWIHHEEMTDAGPRRCRSENVVPFHDGVRRLLGEGPVVDMASALLGEPAVLYKDKINYKAAGGAGYSPHQDAPAYPFIDSHVSAMIAVDDATVANGCLEVASGAHHELLPTDDGGRIRADVIENLEWTPLPLAAGHILWFDSRTPHRSGPNRSPNDRRAIFPTFNARSEGDRRADYYAHKIGEFTTGGRSDGMARVSLIDDFEGRAVT